jgi:ribonuclease M5
MIHEIVVVEGIHDQQKINSIDPTIECIVTNGSEISPETMTLIRLAQARRGVILLLDPDHPGRQITNQIIAAVPGVQVAFINQKDAISSNRKKVGVEHAGKEPILAALKKCMHVRKEAPTKNVSMADLRLRKLVGTPESGRKRHSVCERLSLPPSNGKTFLKWLNMLAISIEQVDEVNQ